MVCRVGHAARISKVVKEGEITIAPLQNLPVIKDLVVDMDPFFDKWIAAEGVHHGSRTRDDDIEKVDEASATRLEANSGIECINCSVCYAACDTVRNNPDFLGPAALQRAWTLLNDVKDEGRQSILEAVSGKGGCHNCHSIGSCTAFCPNDLNPMSAIAGLKRETAKTFWWGGNNVEFASLYASTDHSPSYGAARAWAYRGHDLCHSGRFNCG